MFMETSAKTASNVNELFVAIGACVCSPPLGTGLAMLGRRGHSQMETFCSLSLPSECLLLFVHPARKLPKDTAPAGPAGLSLTEGGGAEEGKKGCC